MVPSLANILGKSMDRACSQQLMPLLKLQLAWHDLLLLSVYLNMEEVGRVGIYGRWQN